MGSWRVGSHRDDLLSGWSGSPFTPSNTGSLWELTPLLWGDLLGRPADPPDRFEVELLRREDERRPHASSDLQGAGRRKPLV